MASLSHIAVGLLAGRVHGGRSSKDTMIVMVGFAGLSLLPDLDVGWVALGVADDGALGHRGFTHSAPFAVAMGVVAALLSRRVGWRPWPTGLLAFVTLASHGFLDALTETTRGVPFLWPFWDERIIYTWRPIPPTPTGFAFLSWPGCQAAGLEVIYFLPLLLFSLWPRSRPARQSTVPRALFQSGAIAFAVIACLVMAELVLRDTWLVDTLQRGASEIAVSHRPGSLSRTH